MCNFYRSWVVFWWCFCILWLSECFNILTSLGFFLFLFSLLDMWFMIIFYYCDCIVSWLPLDFSFYFWFLWGMMILMTCKLNVMVVSRSRWSGVLLFVRAYVLCAWLINCWISCLSLLSLIVYLIHKGFYSLVDLLKIV